MANSGGAAANTGIDYQQRLAAYFIIQMLLEIDSLSGIGIDGHYSLTSISFESSSCIDDIVVKTATDVLYVQAKRSIDMSDNAESEFKKTILQFVGQFLNSHASGDKYILATSSGASSKIRQDLRKILESIRLNDTDFINNPLNQSETDVYAKLINCVRSSYKEITGHDISDATQIEILKKIHVAIADVQQGMPLEGAILTILASKSRVKPELFFSATITLALSLASQRQSINKDGAESRLGNYIGTLTAEKKQSVVNEFFNVEFSGGNVPSGKEVLLIESFIPNQDYLIVELIRFDGSGNKKTMFRDNRCKLSSGVTCNVLFRAASFAGIERYLDEHHGIYEGKKIGIIPINSDDNYENGIFAATYSDYCRDLQNKNDQPLKCLHCGGPISENGAPLIEIDEDGHENAVGLIHKKCLKPLDRVLGVIMAEFFDEYDFLKNFDYKSWFELIQHGQAMFGSLDGKLGRVLFMAWNPDGHGELTGNYCVKVNLEDGSSRYVHHRGKVVRASLESANSMAVFFNSQITINKMKGDPSCYTTKNEHFGSYSATTKMKDDDEESIECTNAEVVNYTVAIGKAYSRYSNYYAPVIVLYDINSCQPVVLNNMIFIMSDPLKLKSYIANWSKAGLLIPEYELVIIKSDHEFDEFMYRHMRDDIRIVGNPLFDMNTNLLSGIFFRHISEFEHAN